MRKTSLPQSRRKEDFLGARTNLQKIKLVYFVFTTLIQNFRIYYDKYP